MPPFVSGRPMNIQLMDGPGSMKSPANPNKASVRQRVGQRRCVHSSPLGSVSYLLDFRTSTGGGNRGGRGRGRGGRGRGRGGGRQPVPTAEELDKDLDAYKQVRQWQSNG